MPQEEVPLYESKGKQFLNRQCKPAVVLPPGTTAHQTIPGLFITEEKDKTKNRKKQTKSMYLIYLIDKCFNFFYFRSRKPYQANKSN